MQLRIDTLWSDLRYKGKNSPENGESSCPIFVVSVVKNELLFISLIGMVVFETFESCMVWSWMAAIENMITWIVNHECSFEIYQKLINNIKTIIMLIIDLSFTPKYLPIPPELF